MPLRFWLLCLCLLSGVVHAEVLSYQRDIQPIFTAKCVACHACYDSPCQLNLGSAEGAQRGASKQPVYDGTRRRAQQPTRLFFDAHDEAGWRRKDFISVLDGQGAQAALMMRMLELGRSQPLEPNAKLPPGMDVSIRRENSCPTPGEFDAYAKRTLHGGMPFAVTGLTDGEYGTLRRWLQQGAPIDVADMPVEPAERAQIERWEALLNGGDNRQRLVARWLYEHLFLAHLYFENSTGKRFYQLVRSRSPSGAPVDVIASRRPNDDPGTQFFYRLRPINDVIVHKTHITYALSDRKLARVRELFLDDSWALAQLPGYGAGHRANPFLAFAAIPARARYQFMLDDAEYFVRTFIRGPVCRGQIATDVIRDNFWVFFQAPEHDLYVTDESFRERTTPLLAMPGQFDELGDLLAFWNTYRGKRNRYEELRRDAYAAHPAQWTDIWQGNDNALLSIFRQHDSASVRKGLIGAVPQTMWWMDYPLLERTYYQLVVNFDVFGNVSHQGQTRLYFDLIRNGAELNFLRLLPAPARQAILDDWYQQGGQLKLKLAYTRVDTATATGLTIAAAKPREDFAHQLLARYAAINARPDPINRCEAGHCHRAGLTAELAAAEQSLSRLSGRPGAGMAVIGQLPEATLIRVQLADGRREIYSLLRNRAHSNVAFMFGEELRYQPQLDTLTVYPGILSSYPNFMFAVRAGEVSAFVQAMERVRSAAEFDQVVERWGVRRSHPEFWTYFHDLSAYLQETEPREVGVLDMNRYENL